MCKSLCFSCFAFSAALNVGAGSAFIWLGFEVMFLSHLSNYVTSRESKTGIAWKNIFRNPVVRLLKGGTGFLYGAYSQLISHVLNGIRRSAITMSSQNVQAGRSVHLWMLFCLLFPVIVLSSHLPDRTESSNSPHKSSIHLKCHQTVGVCASFSGCLTFHTDFLCLAATSAMRGHNVLSVFL